MKLKDPPWGAVLILLEHPRKRSVELSKILGNFIALLEVYSRVLPVA